MSSFEWYKINFILYLYEYLISLKSNRKKMCVQVLSLLYGYHYNNSNLKIGFLTNENNF